MKGIVRRRERARQDLIDSFRYLAREAGINTARRFLLQAERTFGQLAAMPEMGAGYSPEHPAFAAIRYFPIARFKKFLMFYRPFAEGIDIVRVLHGVRDIAGILAEEFVGETEDQEPSEE